MSLVFLDKNFDSTHGDSIVSITPAVDDLLIAVAFFSDGDVTAAVATDDNTDGLGAYYLAASAVVGAHSLGIFVRNSKVGTTNTTVISILAPADTGGGVAAVAARGMTLLGSNAVRQVATLSNGSSFDAAYCDFTNKPLLENLQVFGVMNAINISDFTAPAGFTRVVNSGWNTPTSGASVFVSNTGNDTHLAVAESSTAYASVAIELRTVASLSDAADARDLSPALGNKPGGGRWNKDEMQLSPAYGVNPVGNPTDLNAATEVTGVRLNSGSN